MQVTTAMTLNSVLGIALATMTKKSQPESKVVITMRYFENV